jgi:hypothetical protein
MSTVMKTTTTKKEEVKQNWLEIAYKATPLGECNNKINEIATLCETSSRTVRRWIEQGFVPKQWQLKIVYQILNINPKTLKVKKSK